MYVSSFRHRSTIAHHTVNSYYLQTWIARLKASDVIPQDRRQEFLTEVFWNIHEIISVNTKLRDALNKRQKSYAVVERIGDILLEVVPLFDPFVRYGSHQLYGKYEFEKEKSSNPAFQKFVDVSHHPWSMEVRLDQNLIAGNGAITGVSQT